MSFSLKLALPAMAAALLLPMAAAHAAVLVSDNFEAPGDTIGNAPTGSWTATSNMTATIVSDNTTDPSGSQALDQSASSGSQYSTLTLPSSITLNDGDSLTMSFNIRLTDPASITTGDRKFRFGFYNSSVNEGYVGRMDVGADTNSAKADIWATHSGGLGVSSGSGGKEIGSTSDPLGQLTNSDVDNISLTIARSGNDINETLTITDLTNPATITINGTDNTTKTTITTDTAYTFDKFLVGQNGGSAIDYHLDAVTLTSTTAAPEPASLGVIGIGALALLKRRRRA
ncbi:MAG: PEP-CTERM sorting domain-containing protein [Phycisphaerae bacterium]